MHFHLPKPLHGWREFVGEVGIIVLGVLIALGAEQVIDNLHSRNEVKQTRQALTPNSGITSQLSIIALVSARAPRSG